MNNYFDFSTDFIPFTRVRANTLNELFTAIEVAFDKLPTDVTALKRGTATIGVESGSGNSFVVAMDPTRLSNQNGDLVSFLATHGNTGASTLNVDDLGAVALRRADGTALAPADIATGLWYTARYDSANTRFLIQGPLPGDTAASAAAAAASALAASNSADAAAASADTASTQAGNASSSASSASGFSSAASASASLAQEWAENDEDDEVTGFAGQFSARHWSIKTQAALSDTARLSTSNTFLAAQEIESSSPQLAFYETDGGVDEKRWHLRVEGETFYLSPGTDAGAPVGFAFAAQRSGTTVSQFSLSAGILALTGSVSSPSAANSVGYKGLPQNIQNGNYEFVLADVSKNVHHASGSGHTYTIPANATVSFPIGTTIVVTNVSGNNLTIAITTDTLTLAGTSSTGARTVSGSAGMVTLFKYADTAWIATGAGIS